MGLRRHDTLLLTMGPKALTLTIERLARLAIATAKGEDTTKHVALVEDVLSMLAGIRAEEDTAEDVAAKDEPIKEAAKLEAVAEVKAR